MIDTHVHFWKFDPVRDGWISEDMEVLQRDYLPEDYGRLTEKFDIKGVVAVQADQSEAETRFLCNLAADYPLIRGVVGWVDLLSTGLPEILQEYTGQKILKGFRHILQAEEPGFMLSEEFVRGLQTLSLFDYSYDILVYPNQLAEVLNLVEQLPDQKLVIDHCAKPAIAEGNMEEWEGHMRAIAENRNVYCKVSGLVTEAPWHRWQPHDFYPYLDVVMSSFGPDRVLFSSDWPVIYTSAYFGKWVEVVKDYMSRFDAVDNEKFFSKNAEIFYNL